MEIGEFNSVETNNLEQTFSDSPNNIETSDETSLGETLFVKQDTTYALKKRDDEKIKRIAAAATISVTAVLGGTFLANSFLPSPPTIDNVSHSIRNDTLHYSFDVFNNKKYEVTYTVYIDGEALKNSKIDISQNKHYEGAILIPNCSTELRITSSVVTKLADYEKEIGQYIVQEGSKQ